MVSSGRSLVLIGGGHAHLGVLADWIKRGRPDARTILVSPHRQTRYSGMIPGTVAGDYAVEDGLIDLAALADRAGAELVLDRCIAIDPAAQFIQTESHGDIAFGCCSIDTGGVGMAADALGSDPRLIDVRPIGTFLSRLSRWEKHAQVRTSHIAVVGGGAGGVELAFALRKRFVGPKVTLTLVAGAAGLLDGFSPRARLLAKRELGRGDIELIEQDAVFEDGRLTVSGHSIEPVDLVVASLGAAAPGWPAASGLAVEDSGFIAVDRHQRSLSHPAILAAGDVADRNDISVPRSGVHAVHTGPVLAENLRRLIAGEGELRSYTPRPASLYLLSTADGKAIASYGKLAAHGRWAGWLKHMIDTRWVTSFAKLGSPV